MKFALIALLTAAVGSWWLSGFDSKVQLHRCRPAAVAQAELPHQLVRLVERLGQLSQPLRARRNGQVLRWSVHNGPRVVKPTYVPSFFPSDCSSSDMEPK